MASEATLRSVDHLVYAAPSLDLGMDRIEAMLGQRPTLGGRHPQYRTHNALLSLGGATYLEVIAPDPAVEAPRRGLAFGLESLGEPRLTTWAMRTDEIAETASSALSVGVGPVEAGYRQQSDGTILTWRLTDPYAMPLGGAVPFLISWGDTLHPAGSAPPGGELADLRVEHPDADAVRDAFSVLGLKLAVQQGAEFRLVATIQTERGTVELS